MRYKHISQKPYCCVPACVQMILLRRQLVVKQKQVDMAFDLGVVLPPEDRHMLPRSYPGYPRQIAGTHIEIKKY